MPNRTATDRRFLRRLIERTNFGDTERLLAPHLHRFCAKTGLTWQGLAFRLGCTEEDLNALALCRPPRLDHDAADVAEIAEGTCDAAALDRLFAEMGLKPEEEN